MIDGLTTVIWFLVAICILVPVHEFGHFYAMRRFGVKVLRFSVGFGHRIFTCKDSQGTEFALSAIPLGGYVKPLDERNGDVAEEERELTLGAKTVWQRIIIYAAGPVANFVLAVFFYWFILVIKGTTSYSPVIGKVEPESLAAQAGLVSGQEIIAIDGEATPTRKAVAMSLLGRLGESGAIRFTSKYPDSNLQYESEAQLDGWLRGAESPDPIAGLGIQFYYPPIPKVIDQVLPASAAAKAGFESGDTLLMMDGEDVASWEAWVALVRDRPNTLIDVVVDRGGERVDIMLVPEAVSGADGETIGRAGVSVQLPRLPEEMVRRYEYNPLTALTSGLKETWDSSVFVLVSMKKLVFGEISTKNLSGPIGIAKVAASHAEHGFWAFLSFLAHLSIVLGVLNLLPIPILDGGHIVFCLIEWVKGSPVSQEVQAWSLNVGIIMLFGVMVIAFYNDILRL